MTSSLVTLFFYQSYPSFVILEFIYFINLPRGSIHVQLIQISGNRAKLKWISRHFLSSVTDYQYFEFSIRQTMTCAFTGKWLSLGFYKLDVLTNSPHLQLAVACSVFQWISTNGKHFKTNANFPRYFDEEKKIGSLFDLKT